MHAVPKRGGSTVCLAALPLLLAACATGGSATPDEEPAFVGVSLAKQAESFAPYRKHRVARDSLASHLQARSLPLISGIDFHAGQTQAGRLNLGAATAVSRSGYLLTASHNIKTEPVYALVPDPHRATQGGTGFRLAVQPGVELDLRQPVPVELNGKAFLARRARVVWAGTQALDVAILALDVPLRRWFGEWIGHGEIKANLPVVSAGWPVSDPPYAGSPLNHLQPGLSAGSLLEYGRASPPGVVISVYAFVHSAQPRVGYSGGPLATLGGKLVGVNVSAR